MPTKYDGEHRMFTKQMGESIMAAFRQFRAILPKKFTNIVDDFIRCCRFQETVQMVDRLPVKETTPRSKTQDKVTCVFAMGAYLLLHYDAMLRAKDMDEAVKEDFLFYLVQFQAIAQNGIADYQVKGNKEDGYMLVHTKDLKFV